MHYGDVSFADCSWLTLYVPSYSLYPLCRQGDEPLVCIYVDSCTIASLSMHACVCVYMHAVVGIAILYAGNLVLVRMFMYILLHVCDSVCDLIV